MVLRLFLIMTLKSSCRCRYTANAVNFGYKKQQEADNNDNNDHDHDHDHENDDIAKIDRACTDYQGNEILNAALTNATINGPLQHLALQTLEIQSESSDRASGTRLALIDPRGSLSTVGGDSGSGGSGSRKNGGAGASVAKWDEERHSLVVSGLSSAFQNLPFHSDVDFQGHTVRNLKLEEGAVVNGVILEGATVQNSKLKNVTFENLTLGAVQVESLIISSSISRTRSDDDNNYEDNADADANKKYMHKNDHGVSSLLIKNKNGLVQESETLQEINTDTNGASGAASSTLLVKTNVQFETPIHFQHDVQAKNLQVDSLVLGPYLDSKRHFTDALVSVDAHGRVQSANLTLHEGGWIKDAKFVGDIHFREYEYDTGSSSGGSDGGSSSQQLSVKKQGKIINAVLEGGSISGLEELSVDGKIHCKSNLRVQEDAFIDGSLSVGGSVLGSGPYVDVSDQRLKQNIELISNNITAGGGGGGGDNSRKHASIMEKMTSLQAVSYELIEEADEKLFGVPGRKTNGGSKSTSAGTATSRTTNQEKQIGFIAQDVKKVFPELVSTRPDGYLGVQYSRFVPLLVETIKEIDDRLRKVEEENQTLRRMLLERHDTFGDMVA